MPQRMPNEYRPPTGGPWFWMDETSGVLAGVVRAYLADHALRGDQLALLVDYCRHWIDAPCWREAPGETRLADLRQRIRRVRTQGELRVWLGDAVELGIDPL